MSSSDDTKPVERATPKPSYYLYRSKDMLTPLVALDELPEWLSISGLTRYIAPGDLDSQATLHLQERSQGRYDVQIAVSHMESIMARSMSDGNGDGSKMVPSEEQLQGRLNIALGHAGKSSLNPKSSATSRTDPRTGQTYNPTTPGVLGKKVYCTHWLRTGECDFTQQGCMFLHVMPDILMLETLGFRCYPRWFREMDRSYQETHAIQFDPRALYDKRKGTASGNDQPATNGNGSAQPSPSSVCPSPMLPPVLPQLQPDAINMNFTNGQHSQTDAYTQWRQGTGFGHARNQGHNNRGHNFLPPTGDAFGNGDDQQPFGPLPNGHLSNGHLMDNYVWGSHAGAPPFSSAVRSFSHSRASSSAASPDTINLTPTHMLVPPAGPASVRAATSVSNGATPPTSQHKRKLSDWKPLTPTTPQPGQKRPSTPNPYRRPNPYTRAKVEHRDLMDGAPPSPEIVHPKRFTDKKFLAPDVRARQTEKANKEEKKAGPSMNSSSESVKEEAKASQQPGSPVIELEDDLLMDIGCV